jgi:hypothetical protein
MWRTKLVFQRTKTVESIDDWRVDMINLNGHNFNTTSVCKYINNCDNKMSGALNS